MKNLILILLIDSESISEKILLKSLNKIKKSKNNFLILGDIKYFNKIKKKIFVTNKLNSEILKKKIFFYNVEKKNFTNYQYINKLTKICKFLLKKKIAKAIINMPINKKKYFANRFAGFTEFFSNKISESNKETMLLYNGKFSVSPVTTHIKISEVSRAISIKKIKKTVLNIKNFYKNIIKKKIKIIVLGLNPHAGIDFNKKTEEEKIIIPAIKKIKKKFKDIYGPIGADTAFYNIKKNTCYVGMYHDQILPVFKTLCGFNGVNITIGLKFIRLSPDHGTGKNLIKNKKIIINNKSFLYCIKFCEKYISS